MSYILDALRKSEQERQQKTERGKTEAGVLIPRPPQYASNKKLPLLAGAILLSLVFILFMFGIKGNNAPAQKSAIQGEIIGGSVGVKATKQSVSGGENENKYQPGNTGKKLTRLPAKEFNELPFLWALPENLRQDIGPLTVSIHVYAQEASKRILFINNREYRAGEQTSQGPRIESIEPQGVILSYRGTYFKLPRPR